MPDSPERRARRLLAEMMPRCDCGRFLSIAHRHGWYRFGEHGSEEGWICAACLPGWTPTDSLGRGPEAGYCGIREARPAEAIHA